MEYLVEMTKEIIGNYGYAGIFWLTTAEQFIFPVPADIFVAMGTANGLIFTKVLGIVLAAAVIGSTIGYFLGKYLGHPVAQWLFGKRRLDHGEAFIKKWGIWGVILAGLTPIPFKIVTWTAGIFEMPFYKFMIGVFLGRMPRYMLTAYAGTLIYESKFYATEEMSALILGVLQGVTEFLPISSSGHLVITEHFLELPLAASELLTFDIFLHGGSLLAILIYFWKDWLQVLQELWQMVSRWHFRKNTLATKLILGTLPAIVAALAFGDAFKGPLRNLNSVAIAFMAVGLFYFYVARKGKHSKNDEVSLKNALVIGLAQALALIPGVSRAGTTIGAGVLSGIKRDVATKFSFLLGGVALLAGNVYNIFSVSRGAMIPDLKFTVIGTLASFLLSILSIHYLLKFLKKHTMVAFGIYLLIAGASILSFL